MWSDPPNLLTTTLGGPIAHPFTQTDWPNPRAALQTQENRGFVRAANVRLIGLDKFFGAPGQAPHYDWPNPVRPRYPLQPEAPPNLLVTFVVVAAPFYQLDWPNPLTAKQPQENRGFLRAANVQFIGLDRFFGAPGQAPVYDWPNPQRPRYPVQPESLPNLLTTVFYIVAPPFYQTNWPNPLALRQPAENRGFVGQSLVRFIGPSPFYQTDWPLPLAPRQPQENRGFTRAANVQLIGLDLFFGAAGEAPVYDWPNPQRPRYPLQPEPPPDLLTTTLYVAPPPPALHAPTIIDTLVFAAQITDTLIFAAQITDTLVFA